MKDQYKYNKRIKKGGIYIAISFFFIAVILYFFPEPFFNVFLSGKNIQQKVAMSMSLSEDLILENESLKKQLTLYENPGNLFFFYKNESQQLKKQLGYTDFSEDKRTIFKLLNIDDSNVYNTFLINNSQGDIQINDLVFYKFNLLIGKIVGTIGNVAQIEIFSQAGVKHDFHLFDGGVLKMQVVGIGQGGGLIRVDAPRTITFDNSEKVFLADMVNNSYLVAELVDETFKTQDTNKVLFFKIFANPDLLSQVEIQPNDNVNILPVDNQ